MAFVELRRGSYWSYSFQSVRGLAHSTTCRTSRPTSPCREASWTAVALYRFSPPRLVIASAGATTLRSKAPGVGALQDASRPARPGVLVQDSSQVWETTFPDVNPIADASHPQRHPLALAKIGIAGGARSGSAPGLCFQVVMVLGPAIDTCWHRGC